VPVNRSARVSCVRQRMSVLSKPRPQSNGGRQHSTSHGTLFLSTPHRMWFVANEQPGRASRRQAHMSGPERVVNIPVNAHPLRNSN